MTVRTLAQGLATAAEVVAVVIAAIGLLRAVGLYALEVWRRADPLPGEDIRLGLARSLALVLEVLLVATLLRTVGPKVGWETLGRLAALVGVRVVVGLVLERGVRRDEQRRAGQAV